MFIPQGGTSGLCSQPDKIIDMLKALCTSTWDPWVALNPDILHLEFYISPTMKISGNPCSCQTVIDFSRLAL